MSHQPNNIFAGTQVVSLVEVRGTNNSLVHPRGAVGVVRRRYTEFAAHVMLQIFGEPFDQRWLVIKITIHKMMASQI